MKFVPVKPPRHDPGHFLESLFYEMPEIKTFERSDKKTYIALLSHILTQT